MAKPITTQLLLDGKDFLTQSNYSIELTQVLASHHILTIRFPSDSITESGLATKAKELIGSSLTLVINEEDLVFDSLIVNVSVNRYDAGEGEIIITANSPTIILDHGRDSQSFEKKTIKDIIATATKEYAGSPLKIDAKPKFQATLPYVVQYKESDFDFIYRLASRYGEWFYYDGKSLKFGSTGTAKTPLKFGEDLSEFAVSMQIRPQHHTYMAYDSLKAKVHSASISDHKKSVANPYIKDIVGASERVFSKQPQGIYNHSLLENGKAELDDVLKLKAKHALNTLICKGKSDEPKVSLGNQIEVSAVIGEEQADYGTFIITSIIHRIDSRRQYTNEFEAVPSEIEVPSYFDEDAIPVSEEQYAIVKDNNDPQGLGRIRVQFPWQESTNQQTPWVSVTTLHAGSGKGSYFIPEIGEEVLVGFESRNAEKPFIIGTRYNNQDKTPRQDPEQKIIQTKSGCTIIWNDTEGSLTLVDKDGSVINMDGAGGIMVKSSKTIVLKSKSIGLSADTIAITGDSQVTVGSDKTVAISGKKEVITNGKNVNTSADAKYELGAKQIVTNSTADTLISGALVKINS